MSKMFFDELEYTEEDDFLDLTDFENLRNEKEFLTYLDEEGILEELKLTAFQYEKTVSKSLKQGNFPPPFRFQLRLDIIKIQEVSESLLFLFTKEIDAGMNLAKNVIFCGVQLILEKIPLEKSDLQLIPLIINLPVTCEISELFQYPSLKLECVQGVLMGRRKIDKIYAVRRSSVYTCRSKLCPRNKWQRYPENSKNVCPMCLCLMDEDVLAADTGEEFICQIISPKVYQHLGRHQALNVRVKDELCTVTDFCIGEEYKITGKLTHNLFEALNIAPKQLIPEMNLFPAIFPESITNLYNRVSEMLPNCPWAFVYALASTLGSHFIPVSSYLHLKMGLMLSLATQTNETPSPLVAIGPDSVNTQHLIHIAGKLASRYIRHSIAHSYLGGAAKPGLQSDAIWLEAGQLILAAGGVCNLGDWSKFKKEQANYICQTIESGQIILNKGELGKTNLIDIVPLKCAIWTYWCHITASRNHQLGLKTLINVFGIPFLAEEKNEREILKISMKNLEMGRKTSHATGQPADDLKEFLQVINTREPSISDEASRLIRNYFVLSRRERPHCLPIGAIKTITSLAEAHARLALRSEVLPEDVVAVLYLYEESISVLFGESMNPHSKLVWNEQEPIYVFMSKQLHRFRTWLTDYVWS